MSFLLDGKDVGNFTVDANGTDTLAYNILVYANASLAMDQHNLTIVNGRTDGQRYLMIFDYIRYT